MKKIILIIFICSCSSGNGQQAVRFYDEGLEAVVAGNYVGAIDLFSKALQHDKNFKEAWYNRGLVRTRTGDYDRAIADYTKAIEIDSAFAPAWLNRGADKKELKDYEGSINDYTKAIHLNQSYALAYYNRGIVFYLQADFKNALLDFSSALENDQNFIDAEYNLAMTFFRLAQLDSAIFYFTAVIGKNRSYNRAYKYRGLVYAKKQDYNESFNDWRKTIELNPADCEVFQWMDKIKMHLNKDGQTFLHFTKTKMLECSEKEMAASSLLN